MKTLVRLGELLATLPPNELLYVALRRSAGFRYIGYVKDCPTKWNKVRVLEQSRHTCNYPGTQVTLDLISSGGRSYWFWWEYYEAQKAKEAKKRGEEYDPEKDPDRIEHRFTEYAENSEGWLELYARIAGDLASEYRSEIHRLITLSDAKTDISVNDAITEARHRVKLDFLCGSSVGLYTIQRVEDEEHIRATHRELLEIADMDERAKEVERLRKELVLQRNRKNGLKRYAKIRGKSVYHEGLDS